MGVAYVLEQRSEPTATLSTPTDPADDEGPEEAEPGRGDAESTPSSPSGTETRTPSPGSGTTASGPPTTPQEAAALSEEAAVEQMDGQVSADGVAVEALAGTWVPQVSSKCAGLAVDIGPDFLPDGVVDTPAVTEAQILAFHISLLQRHGVVTTTASNLGVDSMPASCDGRPLWIALVPTPFASSAEALQWCDVNGLPVDECGARRVVPRDETGTELVLRPG